MKIHLVARGTKLTQPMADFIEERIGKLQHHFEQIIWAQVILSIETKKSLNTAEIIVHAARQTFKASGAATDLYAAVDMAGDRIESQVKKYKEKMKDHRGSELPVEFGMQELDTIAPRVRISVIKEVPIRPMTNEDAAVEMERLGYNFWMFQDESTKRVNVIFKRLDDSYGLLKPVKK